MELLRWKSNHFPKNAFSPSNYNATLMLINFRKLTKNPRMEKVWSKILQTKRRKQLRTPRKLWNRTIVFPCKKWQTRKCLPKLKSQMNNLWYKITKWRRTRCCALQRWRSMKSAKRISYRRLKDFSCSSSASSRRETSNTHQPRRPWNQPAPPNSMKIGDLPK